MHKTKAIECNACQKNIQTCQLSSATDKMYRQPTCCNDGKPTKEMNEVRTLSNPCPKDHILVTSSTSSSTSNVALNAVDLKCQYGFHNDLGRY